MWTSRSRPFVLAASAALLSYGAATNTPIRPAEQERKKNRIMLEEKIARASRAIETYMVVHGIPGLAIGVTNNGQKLWSNGYGFANLETATPCTSHSVMRIASISKPFTATIAAKMVQEGKLDLDSNIQKYLPSFPTKKFESREVNITTRQLLSHTGGIRHYEKKDADTDIEDPSNNNTSVKEFLSNEHFESVSEALKMFQDDELVAEPGKKFSYTTHGLTLVSAVLENVSGKDFPRLVRELCAQLGLRHTHLDFNHKIIHNRISYYVRKNGVLENCQEVNNSYKWAGGGLLSNVNDLLTFANAVLYSYQSSSSTSLISKETMSEFWRGEIKINDSTRAALGWMRMDSKPVGGSERERPSSVWYHTGAAVGASSVLLVSPSPKLGPAPSGLCIVILCNLQDTSLLNLARDLEEIFRDL